MIALRKALTAVSQVPEFSIGFTRFMIAMTLCAGVSGFVCVLAALGQPRDPSAVASLVPTLSASLAANTPGPKGATVRVDWQLTANRLAAASGVFEVLLDGHLVAASGLPGEISLIAGGSSRGTFEVGASGVGNHTLTLQFLEETGKTILRSLGRMTLVRVPQRELAASADVPFSIAAPPRDDDQDGIEDALEADLLARFTPYLRFSLDGGQEQYRPMDVLNYVRWS